MSGGPISWMVKNRVTPNLIMMFLIIGGLFMATRIKQEVFPEFELDMVTVSVPYPGASPAEVEQGIVLAVEEAVRGVEGVKEITSTSSEGVGSVNIELITGVDQQKIYQDIKQEIDRITTLPEDAEEPRVALQVRRRNVLTIQLYGEASDWALRNLAEEVQDRLLQDPRITQVELVGARNYEVHVEVSQGSLRSYGLTLDDIAQKISATSVEVPGGGLKTDGGQILVRFNERRNWASEFAEIPIIATPEGSVVTLGSIAQVGEGFQDSDNYAEYNGKPAIGIEVYRVGDETPIGISEAVREAMARIKADLPGGIDYVISNDSSKIYQQRLELLLKNAFMGLLLVLLILGAFLEFRLAFWVTMGIPTSFLGAILFLPLMDVSINMISMFAFIVALGIVVDDAIVAGENIYQYRESGMSAFAAAMKGARDVSVPVAFSIITNILAFLPLYFVPGTFGKTWQVIPLVVVTVFLISWIESLLILPSHLAQESKKSRFRLLSAISGWQGAFSRQFNRFTDNVYAPFLRLCIKRRYVTASAGFALLIIVTGYVASGRIGMILMPRVESDRAVASATIPFGAPLSKAAEIRDLMVEAADEIKEKHGGGALVEGIFATIDENLIEVSIYLTDPTVRPISTAEVSRIWRELVGQIPGTRTLKFESDRGGPGSGAALTIELSHRDVSVLDKAGVALAEKLAEFPNTRDVDDGYVPGKAQFDFALNAEGRSLGLTSEAVARQIRHSFHGSEALRQQRARNEVKVIVRLPEDERVSEYNIENLLVRTPGGGDSSLVQVADFDRGRSYTSIKRRDSRRTTAVSADVTPIGETGRVISALDATILPQLARDFPGLTYAYEGRQADMAESLDSLFKGFLLTLVAIYFVLAVPFKSYTQPVIIMISIPFGIVGAVLGHILMGYDLSVISMMGIVALAGVVVNGALVLIDQANNRRAEGDSPEVAIQSAGVRRFRPIILTTLTTFGGLAPMIFETSRQARFMIPMAISLGYGILFATLISLILVPCLYMILDDALGSRPLAKGQDPSA
ncbi:MAG: efflux RND transporter permease subunit [Deltaproteobacteria bacterium]